MTDIHSPCKSRSCDRCFLSAQRAWRKHRGEADTAAQKLADLVSELQAAEYEMRELQGGDDDDGNELVVGSPAWRRSKLR